MSPMTRQAVPGMPVARSMAAEVVVMMARSSLCAAHGKECKEGKDDRSDNETADTQGGTVALHRPAFWDLTARCERVH
jgi:hypothetical protein